MKYHKSSLIYLLMFFCIGFVQPTQVSAQWGKVLKKFPSSKKGKTKIDIVKKGKTNGSNLIKGSKKKPGKGSGSRRSNSKNKNNRQNHSKAPAPVKSTIKTKTNFIVKKDGTTFDIRPTLNRINAGIKHPHKRDGTIFKNHEKKLPKKPDGYYNEYVFSTSNSQETGLMRLVIGKDGDVWFTEDHYKTFVIIQ